MFAKIPGYKDLRFIKGNFCVFILHDSQREFYEIPKGPERR